uniref:FH2 domain-containing protein n=3 Tax=Octopus bimaculoides TaxID=37653 RepID=A0A0L8GRS3_OCTBM
MNHANTLPQLNVPKPKNKLKPLQWQKIPANKVMKGLNLWAQAAKLFNGVKVDYEVIDELFCVEQVHPDNDKTHGKGSRNGKASKTVKKESTEINLIESRRSLNVNIFLKQFKMSLDEFFLHLHNGSCEKFSTEQLKSLLKILPNTVEIEMLKSYEGDKTKLGNAEQFFLRLIELPNYRVRIEGILIRQEFGSEMECVKPSLHSIIRTATDMKENHELRELLYMVLVAGNYLNSGNYAGNAAGFKMNSLLKVTEIRANKPRMTLMHYVVMQAEKRNPRLLLFPHQMKSLNEAAKSSIQSLTADISNLGKKIQNITTQAETMDEDFKFQMADFLQWANGEMKSLQVDLNIINELQKELADFFCEDVATFKLDECFNTLRTFCEKFLKAIQENKQWSLSAEQSEMRKKQNELKRDEEMLLQKEKGSIVDMLLADVRSGFGSHNFISDNSSVRTSDSISEITSYMSSDSETTQNSDSNQSEFMNGDSNLTDEPASDFIRLGFGRKSMRKSKHKNNFRSNSSDSLCTSQGSRQASSENNTDTESLGSSQDDRASFRRMRYSKGNDDELFEYLGNGSDQIAFRRSYHGHPRNQKRLVRRNTSITFERERGPSPTMFDDSIDSMRFLLNKDKVPLVDGRAKSDTLTTAKPIKESLRKSASALEKRDIDRAVKKREALVVAKEQRYDRNCLKRTPSLSTSYKHYSKDYYHGDENSQPSSPTQVLGLRSPTRVERSNLLKSAGDGEDSCKMNTKQVGNSVINLDKTNSGVKPKSPYVLTRDELLESGSSLEKPVDSNMVTPEHYSSDRNRVSVSVRSQLSRQWQTNLDPENMDSMLKKMDRINSEKNETETHLSPEEKSEAKRKLTSSDSPNDKDNRLRRDRRKIRRKLSTDEIEDALQTHNQPVTSTAHSVSGENYLENNSEVKTPRSRSGSDSTGESERVKTRKEERSQKLTGKRRFLAERFGDKEHTSTGRCRSNVEKESVDRALQNLMPQGSMNRSKSFESVARKNNNKSNMKKGPNSGSTPDTSQEKNNLRGNCMGHFPYKGNDDSENETPVENVRHSSKNSSRLSVKSTSTETLQAENYSDNESNNLFEHKIKPNAENDETNDKRRGTEEKKLTEEINDNPSLNYSVNNSTATVERRPHRVHSLIENSSYLIDQNTSPITSCEDEVNPTLILAKWRFKRQEKRRSQSSCISETEKLKNTDSSNKLEHGVLMSNSECGFKNESSCRNSVASASDKDEGFETMSETISQRTSVSSNLDLESSYGTSINYRKSESNKHRTEPDFIKHGTELDSTRHNLKSGIITVNRVATDVSESDVRKQRTESWTESTVRVNASTLNENLFIDRKANFSTPLLKKGGDYSKDNHWNDTMENKTKPPLVRQLSVSTNTPDKTVSDTADKDSIKMLDSSNVSPKTTPKTASIPSYMKKTSSSKKKVIKESLELQPTIKRSSFSRSSHRSGKHVPVSSQLNKSGSTESVSSSPQNERINQTFLRRSIAGTTAKSTASLTSSKLGFSSNVTKLQPISSPRATNSLNSKLPSAESKITRSTSFNRSHTSSFMSPTASSRAKKDPKQSTANTQESINSSSLSSTPASSTKSSSGSVKPSLAKSSSLPKRKTDSSSSSCNTKLLHSSLKTNTPSPFSRTNSIRRSMGMPRTPSEKTTNQKVKNSSAYEENKHTDVKNNNSNITTNNKKRLSSTSMDKASNVNGSHKSRMPVKSVDSTVISEKTVKERKPQKTSDQSSPGKKLSISDREIDNGGFTISDRFKKKFSKSKDKSYRRVISNITT